MNDAFDRATERTSEERRQKRLDKIERWMRKSVRIHATAFVAVQVLLIAIWALAWQLGGTSFPWFLIVLLGWGLGLAIHYGVIRSVIKNVIRGGPCDGAHQDSEASR
jgi:F0F1-type ATP synthase assembly protein I